MTAKLSTAAIGRAIDHICRFGDTDVFPHLIEIAFLKEKRAEIVSAISQIDLDTVSPIQAIEVIAPKSRLGFRIVHQLNYLDVLLLTAAVIDIGDELERLKLPESEPGPFAYRFDSQGGESLFRQNRTYKDWLELQRSVIASNPYSHVIFTDIADFYARIYLHRIENTLDVATSNKGAKRFIEKVIKSVRSRQSHGIPIGCSASRLIAEVVLADSDGALREQGFDFTRFVDDFRIFVRHGDDPYAILSFLAEQLSITEGLSLNAQKTKILRLDEFTALLNADAEDVHDHAERKAIEALQGLAYFDESPNTDLVSDFRGINLVQMLEREVAEEFWDLGRIRAIFRALRITLCADAVYLIVQDFEKYAPFVKEIVLFFDELKKHGLLPEIDIRAPVLRQFGAASARSIPVIRAWLYEFPIRGIIALDNRTVTELPVSGILDRRQLFLMHGLNGNVNFFRRNKTRFEEKSLLEKGAFLLGATCLPRDEFESWISAIKPNMHRPLDPLFCDWVKTKCGQLGDVIAVRSS
jgi:hypothetical protein